MTLLKEKYYDVLMTNGLSYAQLSNECAKITLESQIELLKQVTELWAQGDDEMFDKELTTQITELQQQLSDLNK